MRAIRLTLYFLIGLLLGGLSVSAFAQIRVKDSNGLIVAHISDSMASIFGVQNDGRVATKAAMEAAGLTVGPASGGGLTAVKTATVPGIGAGVRVASPVARGAAARALGASMRLAGGPGMIVAGIAAGALIDKLNQQTSENFRQTDRGLESTKGQDMWNINGNTTSLFPGAGAAISAAAQSVCASTGFAYCVVDHVEIISNTRQRVWFAVGSGAGSSYVTDLATVFWNGVSDYTRSPTDVEVNNAADAVAADSGVSDQAIADSLPGSAQLPLGQPTVSGPSQTEGGNPISYAGNTVTINYNTTNNIKNEGDITNNTGGSNTVTPENKEDYTFTDQGLPPVPDLYVKKYPDGLKGVWDSRISEIKSTSFFSFINSMSAGAPMSGTCPSWTLNLNGLHQLGSYELQPPCIVWPFVRWALTITALFVARRMVFGG